MAETGKKIKIYQTNREIFDDATREVINALGPDKNKVIDLGSDKSPIFALYLLEKYPDSQIKITHFKDTKTIGRIDMNYRDKNLDYVFKKRHLKSSFFDVATAIFSLNSLPGKLIFTLTIYPFLNGFSSSFVFLMLK